MEAFLFGLLGLLAIGSATAMILSRNAVHSALFLIANFGSVAVLFLMLEAPFISMVQIAVYAGAIMVLFLFVIMLLGAEEATDAVQSFPWVTRAAVVLAVSFLVSMGTPLLLSGFTLPEPPGADPMVRVVHAANVGTVAADDNTRLSSLQPVTVTLASDALEEPLVIDGLGFSDITDFVSVPAGAYTVSLSTESGTFASLDVTLERGNIVTAVAYGERDVAAAEDGFGLPFGVALIPNSFVEPETAGARVQILNVYGQEAQALVNLGANRVLDAATDVILLDDLAYGQLSETITIPEGEYTFGLFNGELSEETVDLSNYNVDSGTEQTVIITPDYTASRTPEGFYRARVLDRAQETLTLSTLDTFGSPRDIGLLLFTDYLLPVNMVGFLLLVGLVGVIVLTRPEGEKRPRRVVRRRKVSRPLTSVISQQTGSDITQEPPLLDDGSGK